MISPLMSAVASSRTDTGAGGAAVGAWAPMPRVRGNPASTSTPAIQNGTPTSKWSISTPAAMGKATRDMPPNRCCTPM